MSFGPSLVKKFLITIFIIAGLFVGYKLVHTDDEVSDETLNNQSYSDEEIEAAADLLSDGNFDNVEYTEKIQFNNSFEHTKPGEYSEIIVNADGFEPGEFTIVYVRFAGTEEYIEAGGQEHTADVNGRIYTRFTITQFGDYEVFLSSDGESYVSPTISVN